MPGIASISDAFTNLEDGPHVHDGDEIIGFFGNDPNNPHDRVADLEIWTEGEKHAITKSALLFVPADMKHCPPILKRVDRPIFHFTAVPGGRYVKDEKPIAGTYTQSACVRPRSFQQKRSCFLPAD